MKKKINSNFYTKTIYVVLEKDVIKLDSDFIEDYGYETQTTVIPLAFFDTEDKAKKASFDLTMKHTGFEFIIENYEIINSKPIKIKDHNHYYGITEVCPDIELSLDNRLLDIFTKLSDFNDDFIKFANKEESNIDGIYCIPYNPSIKQLESYYNMKYENLPLNIHNIKGFIWYGIFVKGNNYTKLLFNKTKHIFDEIGYTKNYNKKIRTKMLNKEINGL